MGSLILHHLSNSVPIYFSEEYIKAQDNDQIVVFKGNQFQIVITLEGQQAHSFRQSPFGSFFCNQPTDYQSFSNFHKEIDKALQDKQIKKIIVRHPPDYYPSFIDPDWMIDSGYKRVKSDVNQYIILEDHPESNLHKMESRKLHSAEREGLLFSHDTISDLEDIHSFIASCRENAGLSVNITLEKLRLLFNSFPTNYSLYSVRKDQEILAACVVARPTPEIYYYYLPATHPDHKSKSPMVLLIVSLMETLKSQGAVILDLGLSSVNGIKQRGLYAFKKRMGARETYSFVYEKFIG